MCRYNLILRKVNNLLKSKSFILFFIFQSPTKIYSYKNLVAWEIYENFEIAGAPNNWRLFFKMWFLTETKLRWSCLVSLEIDKHRFLFFIDQPSTFVAFLPCGAPHAPMFPEKWEKWRWRWSCFASPANSEALAEETHEVRTVHFLLSYRFESRTAPIAAVVYGVVAVYVCVQLASDFVGFFPGRRTVSVGAYKAINLCV